MKIDNTKQTSKHRSYSNRDEIIYMINIQYKKAPMEYKSRHVWVGKIIHQELCKKWKFDHTTK